MFLYRILGIEKNASQSEIKTAYRNIAKKYHPDVNANEGTDVIFKTAKIAYDILSNDTTRSQYDSAMLPFDRVHAGDFLKSFEKDVKGAYLQDLSLSMEFNKEIESNLEYYIANTIDKLTISRGVSSYEIEQTIKKAYEKFAYKANSNMRSDSNESSKQDYQHYQVKRETLSKRSYMAKVLGAVVLISTVIIGGIFGFNYIERIKLEEIRAKEEQDRLEHRRVAEAKHNPELYWKISFASPNNDGTFYVGYGRDERNRVIESTYCVVVGIRVNKDKSSYYYLEDDIDQGIIKVSSQNLSIGSKKLNIFGSRECSYAFDLYSISGFGTFEMTEGDIRYFLFEIPSFTVSIEQLKYKDILIAELNFD
jgi:curved DNA-binding protein CbpA